MAIRAGELIHVGNQVLVDRLQSAGPGLNIPVERIYELGNYESVGQDRDIPDLTFTMESIDASAELEALLTGNDFTTVTGAMNIAEALPIDVASQFKRGRSAGDTEKFEVVGSVAAPFLTLESLSYRFGLRDNAGQTATLRGDGVFYSGGGTVIMEVAGAGTANQEIALSADGGSTDDDAPILYTGDNVAGDRYALAVTIVETGERLTPGLDYTETEAAGIVTIDIHDAVPDTQTIRIIYQTANAVPLTYPQASHAAASATRPAAVKGRDIEVRVGGNTVLDRWSSIQSVQLDWRATLERDEELGNAQVVAQDFDVPECTGTVEIKPRNYNELLTRLHQITGVDAGEVIGPLRDVPLSLDIIIHSPADGSVLKTLHVPDVRFTVPGFTGRVQTKQTFQLQFASDTGVLNVYKGERS